MEADGFAFMNNLFPVEELDAATQYPKPVAALTLTPASEKETAGSTAYLFFHTRWSLVLNSGSVRQKYATTKRLTLLNLLFPI